MPPVWVDHLRANDERLAGLLDAGMAQSRGFRRPSWTDSRN
jgi:hypothetical protein